MEATKKKSKEWRIKNYEYDKTYKATPNGQEAHKRARTKWYAANREGRLEYMRERWRKVRANQAGKKAAKKINEFPDNMNQA